MIALAASAGGVEALITVMNGLPSDLQAAVLIVLHVAPIGPSVLPSILGRHSRLPTSHPADGEPLLAGHAYVAPPDHHLVVEDGRMRLNRGPRENGNRPAADPLFRSVAAVYGRSAAGVVLSGALDDGTSGLAAVKRAGGMTIAQDPEEA
ncbi:MAG TPA: chemotaxis protein CheB, partial [Acidimicrobiales bacterium]|nr:chemotaxis protein CheB [Acidimicrobiales bacterium]